MPILKKATYKQTVTTLSYIFRCSKCDTTEVTNDSKSSEKKCNMCGNPMQLISSSFINKD
jgi:tRNA G26 N,N-dimethylase Trm1